MIHLIAAVVAACFGVMFYCDMRHRISHIGIVAASIVFAASLFAFVYRGSPFAAVGAIFASIKMCEWWDKLHPRMIY